MSSVGPKVVQAGDTLAVEDHAVDLKWVTAILSRTGRHALPIVHTKSKKDEL